MAEGLSSAALVGCTGLVYSALTTLSSTPTIHAIARRDLPPTPLPNLRPLVEPDTSKWTSSLKSLSTAPNIFLSALCTTRAIAGSFKAQRKIDYDLNLALAKAAKESGVKVYVLISSAGVSSSSMFPYTKLKGELEDAVREVGFAHTVLVKPGVLPGARKDSRLAEAVARIVAKGLGAVSLGVLNLAQEADVIGRAAVAAGLLCLEGKREEGVWLVGQSDIIRLGRTEWKGEQ